MESETILDVRGLKKYFPIRKGVLRKTVGYVRALDGISFRIDEGNTVGMVGESGCGKSTAARTIMRAYDPTEGEVLFRSNGHVADVAKMNRKELEPVYRDVQMIFQDPFSSLNPRMTVLEIVGEPLLCNRIQTGKELEERVRDLLKQVGMNPQHLRRYPHAFSGGQRQRLAIARALSVNPKLIIADEAVSALDVSIQAQIINLMKQLQRELGVAYLFISHDLSVVRYISDIIVVMYLGEIVESADARALFHTYRHPYTEALLSAVPTTDPRKKKKRIILEGRIPTPSTEIVGCKFASRCRYKQDICTKEHPPLEKVSEENGVEHFSACFFPVGDATRAEPKE